MSETGIVRRIDELGRIVVPKELRNVIRIHEGSMLEFSLYGDGLMLKKYNPLNSVGEISDLLVGTLAKKLDRRVVVVCDNEVFSSSAKDFAPETLDPTRRTQYETKAEVGGEEKNILGTPIVSGGDVLGNLIVEGNATQEGKDLSVFAAQLVANYYQN